MSVAVKLLASTGLWVRRFDRDARKSPAGTALVEAARRRRRP